MGRINAGPPRATRPFRLSPPPLSEDDLHISGMILRFELPVALPSLNIRDRQHWAHRHKASDDLWWLVVEGLRTQRFDPGLPLKRARMTVTRYSAGMLDADNAVAACKSLLDILCVKSRVHPNGLSIITDDDPAHCELVVKQERAPRGKQKTGVVIEEL